METEVLRPHVLQAFEVGGERVDRVLAHLAIRGPFASGDVHDAIRGVGDLVTP